VVAAVSRAGGFGVLGATAHSPDTVEQELKWIDDHVDGKPYGIDVLIPENISTSGEKDVTWKSLEARISPAHRDFTRNLLKKHGVELTTTNVADNQPQPFDARRAMEVLEVSFRHPIKLIANALGVPPKAMIDMGKKHVRAGRRPGRRQGARACARSRPALIFWSCRAPKPAVIAARCPRWFWFRR